MTDDKLIVNNESLELSEKKQNLPQSSDYPFPAPIQDLIMGYLDGDVALSKQSSYVANNSCTLFECGSKENNYDKLAFTALLGHVVRGEQKQAEEIIRINPKLLFKSGTVKDIFGNTFINYSPCELACYAHDEKLLKMMKSYLDNNEKIQFNKILSASNKELEEQIPYDFSALVAAIYDGDAKQLQEILTAYRTQFGPREIRNEKSFNIKNLQKVFEIYIKNYYPWLCEQCSFFWCKVLGYYQLSLPACYVQAFCLGLSHVVEDDQPLKREFTLSGGQPFYFFDLEKKEGLGFEYGIISCSESSKDDCLPKAVPHPYGWKRAEICSALLEKLIRLKIEACKKLCDDNINEYKL